MNNVGENVPWEVLVVDAFSFLPKSANGYCFVVAVVDAASRWLELIPLRSKDPLEMCFAIEQHIFLSFGPPAKMLLPQGKTEFCGAFRRILEKYNVTGHRIEEADPRLRKMADATFKVAKKELLLMHREFPTVPWDHLLKHVSYKYRNRRQAGGMPPQKRLLPFHKDRRNAGVEVETKASEMDGAIRARVDSSVALAQEKEWFQDNVDKFNRLQLSLKAQAMRSKLTSRRASSVLSFRPPSFKHAATETLQTPDAAIGDSL